MSMENIRTRADFRGSGGNNYLVRGFKAMVRKVENNSQRVTLWLAIASMVVTIGMNIVPWGYNQLIEKGREQERIQTLIDELKQFKNPAKESEAPKTEPAVEQEAEAPPPKKPRQPHRTRGNRNKPKVNGQDSLRATPNSLRGNVILPTHTRQEN